MKRGILFLTAMLLSLSQAAMAEAEREIYISYDGKVATYYYDNLRASHTFTSDPNRTAGGVPARPDGADPPNKVVIDPSMADARLVRETSGMFYFGVVAGSDDNFVSEIEGLEYLDTSEAVSFEGMFMRYRGKTLDLSHLNTDKVTNMSMMMAFCTELVDVEFGGSGDKFNTGNVTDMSYMFYGSDKLKNLNLGCFNTASVTNMERMFSGCRNLTTVCVGSGWNVDNVRSYNQMFGDCFSLEGSKGYRYDSHQNWGKSYAHVDDNPERPGYFWDVNDMTRSAYAVYDGDATLCFCYDYWKGKRESGYTYYDLPATRTLPPWYDKRELIKTVEFVPYFVNARPVTTDSWFSDMQSLERIRGIQYLNTSEVTDMSYMFNYCTNLLSLDVSGFDTQKVRDMSGMFSNCAKVEVLDVSGFSTGNVVGMKYMFSECKAVKALDVSGFSTANVTDMQRMFYNCENVGVIDVSGFSTANVTNMGEMFSNCAKVEELDVSGFSTANVENMDKMFSNCASVEVLDVSGFSTANVTNMREMFSNCAKVEVLDVSGFSTGNVRLITGLFSGCAALKTLELGSFDISGVTSISQMFKSCGSLTELDLSSFNTSNVTNMTEMFMNCSLLETIYASEEFTLENVNTRIGVRDVFTGCTSIVGGMGTTYQGGNYWYARIDKGESSKGYFTNVEDKYYATYDAQTHTVTFLGDGKRKEHETVYGLSQFYEESGDKHEEWEKVVFDETFAKAKPKLAQAWFADCTSLKEIAGLENLNLSKVTDMGYLFYNCTAINVLDLSRLDLSMPVVKFKMLEGLNPECVLYLPSGMTPADFVGEDNGNLSHMDYNLVLDEDGDGQYVCSDLRLKDATDYPIVTPFRAVQACYQRGFTSGRRGTIYLPFAFSTTQFGKIYDYDGEVSGNGIRFYPVGGTTTTANTPYIIDPNGNEITATEVDVLATCDTEPTGANEMIGVCRRGRVPVGAYTFDAANGTLKRVAAGSGAVNISAFRAYFLLPTIDPAGSKAIAVSFDDSPTAISLLTDEIEKAEWLTVDGKRLSRRPDRKGIYIVNGKKYVVK